MLFLGHQAVVRSQFLIVLSAVGTLFPIFLRCLSSPVIEFMLPQSSLEDLQSVVPHTALSGPPPAGALEVKEWPRFQDRSVSGGQPSTSACLVSVPFLRPPDKPRHA